MPPSLRRPPLVKDLTRDHQRVRERLHVRLAPARMSSVAVPWTAMRLWGVPSSPSTVFAPENRDALLARAGVLSIIVIVAAGTVSQLVDFGVYHLRIAALNSATDGGVFGVVGDLSLGAAALVAWLVLLRAANRGVPTIVLPPLLTFLAVDKVLHLHDRIPHWLVLYLPLLAATFFLLGSVAWAMPARSRRLVGIALILLAGSFLVHQYGERLLLAHGAPVNGWGFQIKAVVKHGAEVGGWLMIALGLGIGIEGRGPASGPVDRFGRG
jgi:hypothetical protein